MRAARSLFRQFTNRQPIIRRSAMRRPDVREVVFSDRTLVIAHRGDSRRAPENTLPAFASALELGVDAIELDYVHSRDGVPVVFHDDTLERTTNARDVLPPAADGECEIADYDLADLRRLDAGSWFAPRFAGTQIPTLEETIELAAERAIVMVERKRGDAQACVELLARRGWENTAIVHSLDWRYLGDVHRLNERLLLGALGDGPPTEAALDDAKSLGAAVVGWNNDFITPEAIRSIHARGLKCWIWTVDVPARARELIGWGVDGIISNVPGEILPLVRA